MLSNKTRGHNDLIILSKIFSLLRVRLLEQS